jgi:protocatechuate 3,4-dioxygenase beta subunit
MLALCVLALAVMQAPAANTPALVLGRVVDAATGKPIAGAIVSVHGTAAPSSGAIPRMMTNDAGQFVVRGLRTGTLYLTATKGGYVDAFNGQRRPEGSGQPIHVSEGQRMADVEIRMWKHAVITGSVTDERGEPVVNARVQAYRRGLVAGRPRFIAAKMASTDDRGVYRLAGLTPGDFEVAVTSTLVSTPSAAIDTLLQGGGSAASRSDLAKDFGTIGAPVAPAGTLFAMRAGNDTIALAAGTATTMPGDGGTLLVYPTTFYPAAPSPSEAAVVRIKSGEERANVDLEMHPIRSVRVAGTIAAPEGFAANVPVRLVPAGEDLIPELEVATTLSDASGGFAFPAVPPGQYVVRVIRVPRPPAAVEDGNRTNVLRTGVVTVASSANLVAPIGVPPPIPADATLCADAAIGVGDADVSGIVLMLRAGSRVSGRIEFEGAGDRPDPRTLANMRVTLDPADGATLPDGIALSTGRVDENGQFTTYGVPPGKYFVRASGVFDWFFKGALYRGSDLADEPIELGSSDVSDVVLTFTDRPSSIAGVVRASDNVDGEAVVLAFPVDSTEWIETGAMPRRLRSARADKDGAYLFPALPAGEYYVVAVRDDFLYDWQDPKFLEALSAAARRVRIAEGERTTQDLRTSGVR